MTTAPGACRACGAPTTLVLDLGNQPQAGLYPAPAEAGSIPLFQLRLVVCSGCGLVQLDGDGPDEIDDPAAPPPTSSATIAEHARAMVGELVAKGLAGGDRRILELASHRGYLHPFFAEAGIETTVLAVEPTEAERLAAGGARIIELADFGRRAAAAVTTVDGSADAGYDLIVDHYLLSHLDRPRAALATLAGMLAPDGSLVLETDHLLSIVESCQFDAIRHGHRAYVSLTWLRTELAAVDLQVVEARIEPVYGGALRVWARRADRARVADPDQRVASITAREEEAAISTADGLARFATNVERVRIAVRAYLERSIATDRRVVGYGAPARAVTFLNATGIGPELLSMTADRAPSKQGRVIPGVGVPIVAPDALRGELPADVLVLAWDLADEIRAGMPWVEEGGGRWLVAVPELAVVGAGTRVPLGR